MEKICLTACPQLSQKALQPSQALYFWEELTTTNDECKIPTDLH